MDHAGSLQIEIMEPANGLPALSAAIEVAAYRIILEAITNTIRHGHAEHCWKRFSLAQMGFQRSLHVEIQDDGVGLPENCQSGIGTRSMRERAEEVGGTCLIDSGTPRGTRVHVRVPLML